MKNHQLKELLEDVRKKLSINAEILGNIYEHFTDTDYIVSRAFKKLGTIIQVSREIAKKSHKLIILKGQNAQEDLKKLSLGKNTIINLKTVLQIKTLK